MSLQVIGAGMAPGTLSRKAAIEQLGFGPYYHMLRIFEHPRARAAVTPGTHQLEHGARRLLRRGGVTSELILAQARRALPAPRWWSPRDPQRWFQSVKARLFSFMRTPAPPEDDTALA